MACGGSVRRRSGPPTPWARSRSRAACPWASSTPASTPATKTWPDGSPRAAARPTGRATDGSCDDGEGHGTARRRHDRSDRRQRPRDRGRRVRRAADHLPGARGRRVRDGRRHRRVHALDARQGSQGDLDEPRRRRRPRRWPPPPRPPTRAVDERARSSWQRRATTATRRSPIRRACRRSCRLRPSGRPTAWRRSPTRMPMSSWQRRASTCFRPSAAAATSGSPARVWRRPHVAAAAALLWGANPSATAARIRAQLDAAVDDLGAPGRDPAYGFGVVDLAKVR